jgi:hypothetical protein
MNMHAPKEDVSQKELFDSGVIMARSSDNVPVAPENVFHDINKL